jgi:hypothetical protein
MDRRHFVFAATLTAALRGIATAVGRSPRIVVRSSWQTVNIGDIAHTPGILRLLEQFLPDAEISLWPSRVDHGVDRMLLARFPKLRILVGEDAVASAFREADFLLHGSGPSLVGEKDVRRWHETTGKPFGIYGITFGARGSTATAAAGDDALAKTISLFNASRFVFFRDSRSLAFAKAMGADGPVLGFAPDAAFAVDLRDDAAAETFLAANGLEPGRFLCCIPRLRYTPYWTISEKRASPDPVKQARNEEMKEHDHRPLREAILSVIRETPMKVLLCPEDRTQMQVGKELLLDRLPSQVRSRVVWRPDYWLTAEAVATYVRSAGLFGNEMHSPILCIGNGVPAIVCRWAEQTSKGYMWEDIGLGDWLFDLDDEAAVARVAPAVLELAADPAAARAKAGAARDRVLALQKETMGVLRESLKGV